MRAFTRTLPRSLHPSLPHSLTHPFSSLSPTPPPPTSFLTTLLHSLTSSLLPHYGPLPPIVLYDALHCDTHWEDDWMCTSDKAYGGPSLASLTYAVDTPSTNKHTPSPTPSLDHSLDHSNNAAKRVNEEKSDATATVSEVVSEGVSVKDALGNDVFHGFPFMRFEGSLDMSARRAQELGVSGGFCAVRGEVDCPQELNEYEGFEIVYRSAAQVACIVNVTMENMTPEDVYQTKMVLAAHNKWMKLHIPLSNFRLTLIGKDREAQGVVEGSNVETFGLLIRNHQGPFCIDIHSIKVIEKLDSEHIVQEEFKRPSFYRQLQ